MDNVALRQSWIIFLGSKYLPKIQVATRNKLSCDFPRKVTLMMLY